MVLRVLLEVLAEHSTRTVGPDESARTPSDLEALGGGETVVRALYEIDLSVDAGHLAAVMGPSGCQKSTLPAIAGTVTSQCG